MVNDGKNFDSAWNSSCLCTNATSGVVLASASYSSYGSEAARDYRIVRTHRERDQVLIRNARLRDTPAITEVYGDAVFIP